MAGQRESLCAIVLRRRSRLLCVAVAAFTLSQLALADTSQEISAGRQIAIAGVAAGRASCAACHRADGTGQPMHAIPALAGLSSAYLHRQLTYFADGQRESAIMAPYAKRLNDSERQAVAAYFASLAPVRRDTTDHAPSGLLTRGKALFENGIAQSEMPACVKCHGADGRGIDPLSPSIAGQSASYIERQLSSWHAGKPRGPAGVFMRAEASHLSKFDIEAVSAYVAGLPATREPARNGDAH